MNEADQEFFHRLWFAAEKQVVHFLAKANPEYEDPLAEVYLSARTHFNQYDPNRPFLPWIKAIARNHLIQIYRDQQRERAILEQERLARLEKEEEALQPQLDARVQLLLEGVATLDGPDRELMDLFLEGMLLKEIAAHLQLQEGTVRSQYSRIRDKLRAYVQQQMEQPYDGAA